MERRLLTAVEARVLGCLIEKEATTPDTYPLSLNALCTACNQKSNRDPVMNLDENAVLEAVQTLQRDTLIAQRSSTGSRVMRYMHRLHARLENEFDFSASERAVLCLLFLRGAQTGGEIRTRCARIFEFKDLGELDVTLNRLMQREDGPYVIKLPRQPGQKEARYMHLLCGEVAVDAAVAAAPAVRDQADGTEARIAMLENKVADLQDELNELRSRLNEFIREFE